MKPIAMQQAAKMACLAAVTVVVMAAPTLACAAEAPPASIWSRLWRTPDQLGQSLINKGDAAGAAQAFSDPEHKAHAALQAGDYAGAAQMLNGIDKADAHYNRGNALAHTGDLQGAIQAYDAALKRSPQHSDARHNRDVVAAALQKQKDDKKDSSQKDKQGKDDSNKQDGKDSKNGQPGNKPGDGKDAKPDKQASSKPGEQPASTSQPGTASAAPATAASAAKDDSAQARRDAESALGKGTQPPPTAAQAGASTPNLATASANDAAKQKPLTEKQIAQDQWLRAIPDDPGGLLRRKFLIEHMLRQQGQKP
jgi:Ca-activated chloride channel family protein